MSTRCIIKVRGVNAKLYRHYDGYPEGEHGVLATLVTQVRGFISGRGFWDPQYLLARLAHQQIQTLNPYAFTGFGIVDRTPLDVEYIYNVLPTCVVVFEASAGRPVGAAIKTVKL